MRAEILSCGTELLLGHISDTNATYLAQSLTTLGVDLYYVSQVGDNQPRIVETLRRAWDRSDLIIMTGGLGPTEDDLTRESISELVGETMVIDPDQEAILRERFLLSRNQMPLRNLKQASIIPSAQILPNPRGSAPGWFVEKDGRVIVAMPGVPHEMFRMWEEEAILRLKKATNAVLFTRIFRVLGIGESTVEEVLGDLIHNNNPTVATYAKIDAVDVRVTAKAENKAQAEKMVLEAEEKIRTIMGDSIFGIDRETLAGNVGKLLIEQNQTIAVMESLTGGLISSSLTDMTGSSAYFVGGVAAYSTEIKIELGVPRETIETHGVISQETADAMASAIRERFGSQLGLAVTGVAGPDLQENKPVGTCFIALATPGGVLTSSGFGWRGDRIAQKRYVVFAALDLLRRYLEQQSAITSQ